MCLLELLFAESDRYEIFQLYDTFNEHIHLYINIYMYIITENSPSSNGKDGQCTLANGASVKATEPCPEPLITCNSIASKGIYI